MSEILKSRRLLLIKLGQNRKINRLQMYLKGRVKNQETTKNNDITDMSTWSGRVSLKPRRLEPLGTGLTHAEKIIFPE